MDECQRDIESIIYKHEVHILPDTICLLCFDIIDDEPLTYISFEDGSDLRICDCCIDKVKIMRFKRGVVAPKQGHICCDLYATAARKRLSN